MRSSAAENESGDGAGAAIRGRKRPVVPNGAAPERESPPRDTEGKGHLEQRHHTEEHGNSDRSGLNAHLPNVVASPLRPGSALAVGRTNA